MPIDWDELQKELTPLKDYEDLCRRFRQSFGYAFVHTTFNFSIVELASYTDKLLGGDARGRYSDYSSRLAQIFTGMQQAGVKNVLDLVARNATREQLEIFTLQSGIPSRDTVALLKYLVYWFIPGEKYLSGLVQNNPEASAALRGLAGVGIRTNLQLLEQGITLQGRMSLSKTTGLPLDILSDLVNRADFSRMPWASKATLSNIIGAGYASLQQLKKADPAQLYADFFRYGKSIGKNLKLGNEIENSYRIAQIIPALIRYD